MDSNEDHLSLVGLEVVEVQSVVREVGVVGSDYAEEAAHGLQAAAVAHEVHYSAVVVVLAACWVAAELESILVVGCLAAEAAA